MNAFLERPPATEALARTLGCGEDGTEPERRARVRVNGQRGRCRPERNSVGRAVVGEGAPPLQVTLSSPRERRARAPLLQDIVNASKTKACLVGRQPCPQRRTSPRKAPCADDRWHDGASEKPQLRCRDSDARGLSSARAGRPSRPRRPDGRAVPALAPRRPCPGPWQGRWRRTSARSGPAPPELRLEMAGHNKRRRCGQRQRIPVRRMALASVLMTLVHRNGELV